MKDSLLKETTNAFVNGFGDDFCNKICPDTIACGSGKRYEKLWLDSIKHVDFQNILDKWDKITKPKGKPTKRI